MSAWTWVLIGLCAAGVLLALGATIPVITAALRVRAKIGDMKRRPLFLALESMRLQGARLSRVAADIRPLAARAQAAADSTKSSVRESGAESADALGRAGSDLQALYEDLR